LPHERGRIEAESALRMIFGRLRSLERGDMQGIFLLRDIVARMDMTTAPMSIVD
jgi:hypothetical protein